MKTSSCLRSFLPVVLLAGFCLVTECPGQGNPRPPRIISPEISADRMVTFRLRAPKAETVKLDSGDLGKLVKEALTRGSNDVLEVTVGPVNPGAYRYRFNVDGVSVVDPQNPATSESNDNTWSLFYVSGSDFMDTKDVPHGSVAEVTYYSSALKRFRRLHVYTPPGYETGSEKLPVFYLLHGASDSDASWSTVGRAGFILDNLIAAGKAKPMVVVMPAGHTGRGFRPRSGDEFQSEFVEDIMPLVEKRYRVLNDRAHRAMAGLSMGGGQTLDIGIKHLDKFSYLGVFSSGVFGIVRNNPNAPKGPNWEETHQAQLDDATLKPDLKLVWFSTGKEDPLLKTTQATVEMLKKHQFEVTFHESSGGHTWVNWRDYMNEFVPQLFQ